MISNKIANGITNISKNSQQSNSETVTNKHDKEIHKERYLFREKRQEVIWRFKIKIISKNHKSFKKFRDG